MKKEIKDIKNAELIKEKEIIKDNEKVDPKATKKKGFSLGCLFGMHAYRNNVCIYCGKRR